ncbi:hypothetical protein ACFE04_022869 [Oxalis oulophora]
MYQIAIVHDIAQAIVGDITPSDGVPNAENKRAAYSTFILLICSCKFQELWSEYENNASLEANLVKDFDKVEMILQALEYEIGTLSYFYLDLTFVFINTCYLIFSYLVEEHGKVLNEFFISTAGKFQTEIGKSWPAEIISRRKSRLTNKC